MLTTEDIIKFLSLFPYLDIWAYSPIPIFQNNFPTYTQAITPFNSRSLHQCTVQVSKTIIQVTSAYVQVKCVQCIPNFSGFLYTRSTVIYIEVLLYVCNLFIFWCIYSSISVHRSSWDVYIIIISIHRCLQIILKLPITQLPEVLRYKFQNISECILVQSQFLVVQHPFLGTLHP